jgi:hypothetical protein
MPAKTKEGLQQLSFSTLTAIAQNRDAKAAPSKNHTNL